MGARSRNMGAAPRPIPKSLSNPEVHMCFFYPPITWLLHQGVGLDIWLESFRIVSCLA